MQAYLFDIGNVLLHFDFTPAAQALAAQSQVTTEDTLRLLAPFKDELETGLISDDLFIEQSIQLLGFQGNKTQFTHIWNNIFTPNQPMFNLVEQLAQKHPLYLLSNTSGLHKNHFLAKYPIFNLFQGGIFSHEAKCAKPSKDIFHLATNTFQLNPTQTLFIDDLADNINTAQQLGFHTHHYHHQNHQALLQLL